METPSANSELGLQLNTAAAAAWHVLGLLLSHGRPTEASELASNFTLFYPTPDFICFLCSIPNSPLRFTENHFVTFSQIGVAAVTQFIANSDVISRYVDLPQFVPRLLANARSNDIVRTSRRKRKRLMLDFEYFSLMRKRSYFHGFNAEKENLNQTVVTVPGGFQKTQVISGIETLPSLTSLLVDKCWDVKNMMLSPTIVTKFHFGQLDHEIKDVQHKYNGMEGILVSLVELGYLHKKGCKTLSISQGRFPYVHKPILADEIVNSAPHPKLSLLEHIMGNSEENNDGAIDILNPVKCTGICASSKLEVDEMKFSQLENKAIVHECKSLTEDVNTKRKEDALNDSGRCRGHKEYPPVETICADMFDTDNPEKTEAKSDNVPAFVVSPGKGHLRSQGDMLNHLVKYSLTSEPDQNNELNDGKKPIYLNMDNCTFLRDKRLEKSRRDKVQTSDKKKAKLTCDQNMNAKERETSMENGKRYHVEQKPFPNFESFIVEEEEGSGGYGTVYRARRKADGVTVAIKCPHVNANVNYVHNELKMLERLGGKDFVIKFEGSLKSGSSDCLVLKHVKHNRPEILKREIDIDQLQWYAYCLFKALASLHKQGIIHRDIKPGNFLFSRKVNKGYLIDFNLALDLRKKFETIDKSKAGDNMSSDHIPTSWTKSLPPEKNNKLLDTKFLDASNKKTGELSKSLLPAVNLRKKVYKEKVFIDNKSKNNIKSQGADGSGITSAKDATSTKTPSAERLKEPLPNQGRKELLCLVQEALQGRNQKSVSAPKSKRKRVAAPPGDVDGKIFYPTPMPLHANGIAILGAGLQKSKVDRKHRREGPCVGTKGFKAPEVLFRSLHQGPKMDIWSAGVTLLYLMIGRTPFTGDNNQNIKEIAKLRGSEDLWEVAKLHNHESLFPTDLLDFKYLSPVKLQDWCARNTRRPDFLEAIPKSLFDLVDKCLMVNPRQRISAEEALLHEFFIPCHEALRKHWRHDKGLL